jgi:rhodanese-related sulfurtransferase
MSQISPNELKDKLDQVLLLDCREPWEHEACAIGGSRLIPMKQVPQHLAELKAETKEIVVYCHHGMRSLSVVNYLRGQGVPALSLSGGIDRWSQEIDPAVPRY